MLKGKNSLDSWMHVKTPVAFLIFNRPDTTERVFAELAKAKPSKLFIVADGPRPNRVGEARRCAAARAIIEKIDWDCELFRNYADYNMGCARRVSTGIDWVFEHVEEAIILEDDCLPAPSFFFFCETLLNKYRNDERAMMISGDNFQLGQNEYDYSYYFSKYSHTWGWASWRRAWKHYDVAMKTWPEYKNMGLIETICENRHEQNYWTRIFDSTFEGRIDTWDYQWCYACWTQGGLSILPSLNLVSNIGFGPEATHTFIRKPNAGLPTRDIWDIKHPPFVFRNRVADDYTFRNILAGSTRGRGNGLRTRLVDGFAKLGKRAGSWF
jgi:hypothetical protein